jgi:Cu/Ag efflux pump CusA
VFWGPMAFAIMGGLMVGTVLTLILLPVLYVTVFDGKTPAADRIERQTAETEGVAA